MPQPPAQGEAPWLPPVRTPGRGAPVRWLAAGARDMRAAPVASLAYGTVFAAMGYALERALGSAAGMLALIPLATNIPRLTSRVSLPVHWGPRQKRHRSRQM